MEEDTFRSLENESEETQAWVRAQYRAARNYLDPLKGRTRVIRRLEGLQQYPWRSLPTVREDRQFFLHRPPGVAPTSLYVSEDGVDRRLVAPEAWGDPETAAITSWSVSPDGSLVSFQVASGGIEETPLRVLEVATGRVLLTLDGNLRSTSVAWSPEGGGFYFWRTGQGVYRQGLYFVQIDSREHRPVWLPPETETPLFGVPAVGPDGRHVVLAVRHGADTRNELLVIPRPAEDGAQSAPLRLVRAGERLTVAVFGQDGLVYVLSQRPGSTGELHRFSPELPQPEQWRELFAANAGARLADFFPLDGRVVVVTTSPTECRVLLIDGTTGVATEIHRTNSQPVLGVSGACRPTDRLWIETAPADSAQTVLEISAPRGLPADGAGIEPTVWFQSHDRAQKAPLMAESLECRASDGVVIPVTVLRGQADAGVGPLLLSVYGGFGVPFQATFNPLVIAWVLSGGTYAIAHVRGGGERGRDWHEAGRAEKKTNSVSDLISVAQFLCSAGMTSPARLVVSGGSNGGLLACAAAVARPDLFAACAVTNPVTDMIRYPVMGEGAAWLAEYGDPEQPEARSALMSYSPCHNVRPGVAYPAFMLIAGAADRRVPPAHSRKFVAAVQAATSTDPGHRPVLLLEEPNMSHDRIPASRVIEWQADRLCFMADQVGLDLG